MQFIVKKDPKVGAEQTVKKFAWLPVDIKGADYTVRVWLQHYYEDQKYVPTVFGGYGFVTLRRYVK